MVSWACRGPTWWYTWKWTWRRAWRGCATGRKRPAGPGTSTSGTREYLRRCIETGERAAAHYGWRRVALRKDGEIREIDEKHEEIFSIVRGAL